MGGVDPVVVDVELAAHRHASSGVAKMPST
jgi:hypothetical protein